MQRLNVQDAANFQSQAQANGQTGTTKGAEQKKRATIELCATSIIATITTRRCRNGHISKWSKKFIKAYGKEKGYSYIYGTEMHLFYMLKINMITKDISKH
jgi:outer membrane protein